MRFTIDKAQRILRCLDQVTIAMATAKTAAVATATVVGAQIYVRFDFLSFSIVMLHLRDDSRWMLLLMMMIMLMVAFCIILIEGCHYTQIHHNNRK